eukprot:2369141-Rhodomonas_salina.1
MAIRIAAAVSGAPPPHHPPPPSRSVEKEAVVDRRWCSRSLERRLHALARAAGSASRSAERAAAVGALRAYFGNVGSGTRGAATTAPPPRAVVSDLSPLVTFSHLAAGSGAMSEDEAYSLVQDAAETQCSALLAAAGARGAQRGPALDEELTVDRECDEAFTAAQHALATLKCAAQKTMCDGGLKRRLLRLLQRVALPAEQQSGESGAPQHLAYDAADVDIYRLARDQFCSIADDILFLASSQPGNPDASSNSSVVGPRCRL